VRPRNLALLSKVLSATLISLFLGSASVVADTEKILHTFADSTSDGNSPYAGVTLDNNGNLYGATGGGADVAIRMGGARGLRVLSGRAAPLRDVLQASQSAA
jgi:hypothetical protein